MYKIVIIGPEATGKSTMAQHLSQHFEGTYIPEYARLYLEEINRPYNQKDLSIIAENQFHLINNDNKSSSSILKFIDTDLHVIKVWSQYKYDECKEEILRWIAVTEIDYYLLMNVDLPWEYDVQREHPDIKDRMTLFHHYKDIVIHSDKPFDIVSGIGEQRLVNGIKKVEGFIKSLQL